MFQKIQIAAGKVLGSKTVKPDKLQKKKRKSTSAGQNTHGGTSVDKCFIKHPRAKWI